MRIAADMTKYLEMIRMILVKHLETKFQNSFSGTMYIEGISYLKTHR